MLKFTITEAEFEGLAKDIQGEYKSGKADDDKVVYTLDTDGVSNEEVKGLRAKNNQLLGTNKTLKDEVAKFADVDLEAIEALNTELADLKLQVGDTSDAEEVIKERIKSAVDIASGKLQRQLTEKDALLTTTTEERDSITSRYRKGLLKSTITDILPDTVQVTAIPDIILNAQTELEYSEDMNDGEGGWLHKKTGADATDWLDSKLQERSHWLKPSEGDNLRGGGKGPGGDSKAPQSYDDMMDDVFKS